VGGYLGAGLARRLPEWLFRIVVLALGLGGAACLMLRQAPPHV
jgi:uncharacterized membrane protein YfcA